MSKLKSVEVEIKLPVENRRSLHRRLAATGAIRLGQTHELDTLFDTPRRELARTGRLIRVRLKGKRGLLTYKGPPSQDGAYKERPEIEVPLPMPGRFQAILEALGFRRWFQYEKYRTSYRLPGLRGLAVEVDRTPIGTFLELEGSKKAIDRAAKLLGYRPADYIKASYYALYRQARRKRGLRAGDMVFRHPKSKK